MAVAQGPFLAVVLLLASSGHHCVSPLPTCSDPCTCQIAPLLNCSSSGLSLVPQHIRDSVTELDLSHNLLDNVALDRPHRNLRAVWLGNNSITRLSLCIERNLGGRHARGRPLHRMRPWSRWGCVSWAPTLQLLSVERNQLEQLPEGLEGSESLQVLQLSFNRISTLRPRDLSRLQQLTQLHLQHNLITSLHPQMFQDLAQLRVLDLSFNKLTSLHPLMYLSLRKLGADVRLAGNRWQCDCSMRSLRRRLLYDSSRGLQAWSVVCASPSILSGRDVLQLEENDLNCFSPEKRPELYQDVTVYRGSELLLSCSAQDSTWWTPSGPAQSVIKPQAGLLLSDITERDTGLYVCVSEEHEVLSVFNLQISKIEGAKRKTRSLPGTSRQLISQSIPNRAIQGRNQRATQSDLTLAVCLSVFITFLIAFILGVLARPCIDILWRRIRKKKDSPETNSVATVEQRQSNNAYDNEACSVGEEPEMVCIHRERRVTFSDIGDSNNVQYYDTVANGDQESINSDAVFECETVKAEKDTHTTGDSGSENSFERRSQEETQRNGRDPSGITDAGHTHNIESDHIPDPDELEERRSMSSCSDSSLSDKVRNVDQMTRRDNTTPKSTELAEESLQQRADFQKKRSEEMPQISIEGSEIPEFFSEPFADWSLHAKNRNLADSDLWQQNEEEFEFSDSVRSMSARSSSVCGSFNDSKLIVVPTTNKQAKDNISSSSSCVSGDEPTEYTVNSCKEEDLERNHNNLEATNAFPKQDASFQQQIHGADYTYDTERRAVRPKHSFSSHSSDSDWEDQGERDIRNKVVPMPRTKRHTSTMNVTSHGNSQDAQASSRPAGYSSSSSSESEIEVTKLKAEHNKGQVSEGVKTSEPETLLTNMDVQFIPQIKNHFDINTPSPVSDTASSDDSMDETTKHTKRQEQGDVNMTGLPMKEYRPQSHDATTPQLPPRRHPSTMKRHLDIGAPSLPTGSSSSSESGDETMDQKQEKTRLQFQETVLHDSVKWRPVPNFQHIPQTTRYKDIKAPTPASESSFSSDSEAERAHNTVKQGSGIVLIAGIPFREAGAGSHSLERRWPAIQLEHIRRIKRRLDIKAPSPPLDSSSSSDSEDETTNHRSKQKQWEMYTAMLPVTVSQTVSHGPQTQWPALDLEHTTRVKRRLDIKAPSPDSDSSSSSDSDGETTGHIKKQEPKETYIPTTPIKVSQTVSRGPQAQWPTLDLERTLRVKRRLDIKAPSPDSDSSSSSDSDGETTGHIKKQEPKETYIPTTPIKVSQTVSRGPQAQWPALDLERTLRVKRRLDIKAPSPDSDSSSSSDSDGETTGHIKKQEPKETYIPTPPIKVSQTVSRGPQAQWPALDLERTLHVKRRLDIKATSPDSDSSSSSDSEDETTNHVSKQEQWQMHTAMFPMIVSQIVSNGPQTLWPVLDLEHVSHVKRRLDIKATLPESDSSSSSDSEVESTGHIDKQKTGTLDIAGRPFQEPQRGNRDSDTQWPVLNLEHTTRVKRRLDIKATLPDSDSSCSSDSEDETTNHVRKQEQWQMHMPMIPITVSQTVKHGPQTQWPALDLEHISHVKRRLDIKATLPDSDSSSSSDSDGETTGHIKKQEQRETYMPTPPMKVSQTVSHGSQTQWPALDLKHITRVKKRLDIKAPSPDLDSSSSSDSGDETTGHTDQQKTGTMDIAGRPFQEPQRGNRDSDTQWPVLNLDHTRRVKRRLDIKATLSDSDSSSSNDSEDETTGHMKKQEQRETYMPRPPTKVSQTVSRSPQTQWSGLDLDHVTRIKRGLDVKAQYPASESSSSSDSEGETHHTLNTVAPFRPSDSDSEGRLSSHTVKHERDKGDVRITNREQQTKLHEPRLNIPYINTRLDIKAPSPQPDPILRRVSPGFQQLESRFSGSDSEGEKGDHAKLGLGVSAISKTTEKEFFTSPETPVLHTSHSPRTDPDVKLEKYTVITDYMGDRTTSDNINTTPEINPELESRWATMNLGISRFRKHLKITSHSHEPPNLPSSPPPDLPSSSSSDKEAGSKHRRTREKRRDAVQVILQGITHKESVLTSEGRIQDDNSGNSVERLRNDYSSPKTEEQSKPDTRLTSFDTPYSMRHVDIKVSENVPTVPPLYQLPDSSSSSENEDASTEHLGKRWRGRSQLPVVTENLASQIHTSLNVAQNVVSQNESMEEGADQDTIDYSVTDLSPGVPHIKRHQIVKAPSSGSSNSPSSSSESEVTGYSAKQNRDESDVLGMTDTDSLITYKRLIFKASPPLSSSPSSPIDHTKPRHAGAEVGTVAQEGPSHTVGGQHPPLAPMTFPSMRFDDVVKTRTEQFRHTTGVDLPSEIRWTGTGRQLSDFAISSPRRNLVVGSLTPQQERSAMPELSPFNFSSLSSSETDDKIKKDSGKADGTLMYKYSTHSASSDSPASSRALEFDDLTEGTNYILGAEDKRVRKGLSALKAMSSERRKWDTQNIDKDVSPPVLVDDGPQVDTSFYNQNFKKDIKPPTKQPQIQLDLFSTPVDERIATDLLHGVPQYRRHGVGGMGPQVALPPIPTKLPPLDDAETSARRSPKSSEKRGLISTRFQVQQSRKAEEPDPITSQNLAVPFDSSNDSISYV